MICGPSAPGYGTASGFIVDQFGSPARPFSLPHQRTSGPASENITACGCRRRTSDPKGRPGLRWRREVLKGCQRCSKGTLSLHCIAVCDERSKAGVGNYREERLFSHEQPGNHHGVPCAHHTMET